MKVNEQKSVITQKLNKVIIKYDQLKKYVNYLKLFFTDFV